MKILRLLLLLALVAATVWPGAQPIRAQDGQETPPVATPTPPENPVPAVHVVQDGENLTTIAAQYDVSVQELLLVNGLTEDDLIFPGDELTIPGAAGDVVAGTYTVQVGDTLQSIAAAFNTTPAAVAGANRLLAPHTLYAGQTLSVTSRTGSVTPRPVTGTLHVVQPGQTLLTVAARYRLTPQTIAEMNDLPAPARLYPGMRLRLPGDEPYQFLSGGWQQIRLRPAPIVQGETMSIYVEHALQGTPNGRFAGQPLHFAPYEAGHVALVGLDAFTEPGRYTLQLSGEGRNSWWPFRQNVQVAAGDYPTQTIDVPQELEPLLEPEVRAEEDAFLSTIYGQFTPQGHWEGRFQMPVTNTVVTAGYGGARSYNGGPYEIFHTGVDFGGTTGTPIMAPAPGTVVYTGTLDLRGGTVIIDHGLGVYSGYYHLSEILTDVDRQVQAGQIIARGGSTGLSTGPHLHWELRVMDVPVNGLQWTEVIFP